MDYRRKLNLIRDTFVEEVLTLARAAGVDRPYAHGVIEFELRQGVARVYCVTRFTVYCHGTVYPDVPGVPGAPGFRQVYVQLRARGVEYAVRPSSDWQKITAIYTTTDL
ncbi:MAG: hypothetical protein IT372_22415 [Polyangiaceae bacterium]|nr:hypothetical protein [Polyangiaceae bacterium]